ncbi:LysR family transcriptional regulator [Nonomuraea sp. WAC 01424]|uniref:LysR substrate-binding domain-containing protein n=1 Tax=Nonomuraea sp. WAC 01424 TaxID=2203200 RepID=UPI000F76B4AD|nr:LysR family transcriptional regulator [Nonomuraea sp. WAC 01424]RSN15397.1 LysR family transcriptional regulator [Nonomuraea sp. WAC 01424]
MELMLLRAFLTVAELGTYGSAAQKLLVTQPTLTKQIQSLEARVGGRLFHRGRHGATLTDLGAILLPEAQELVRRADALALRMTRAAAGEIGRLSVGFGLSSIDLAPRAVAAFRRCHPDAHVTLDDMSSQEQFDRLATGELDVGFVRLPEGDDWAHMVLDTDRLALASTGEHTSPPQDTSDLPGWVARHRFVQLRKERGSGLVGQIERLCGALSVRPDVIQEADDLQTVLALVAAGVGAAFVPARAGRIAPPPVTVTPLRHPVAEWQIAVVWNRDRVQPMTANFLAVLERGATSPPDDLDRGGLQPTPGLSEVRAR